MRYSIRTSNYSERITIFDLTLMMSMNDLIAFGVETVKASPIGLRPILLSPISSLFSLFFSIYFSYSRMYTSHQTLAVGIIVFVLPIHRLLPLLPSLLTWYQSEVREERAALRRPPLRRLTLRRRPAATPCAAALRS